MERQAEDLFQKQNELLGRISRLVENLKKTGQANITSGAVQSRLTTLDSYWTKFEEHHDVLCTKYRDVTKQHEYTKKDIPGLVEEAYLKQKGILLDYAEHFARISQPNESANSSRVESSPHRSSLPRIQLPHFAGKFEDWPSFKDLFLSIIGKEVHLGEVEKLHYLKVCLKGEAESLVKNLPTTAENYTRAWDTLCNYYENKRLLVRSCLSKFTSLSKMKAESAVELRKILHGVSQTVSTLESIGRPVSSCEDLLVHLSAELLDSRTRRAWENSIEQSSNPPPFKTLKDFLERRMHTLEVLQPQKHETTASKANEYQGKTARTHHARKREPGSGRCSACNEDHFLMFCANYKSKSAEDKRHHVQQNNLCVNCLSRHKISECASKRTCSVCAEKHHTSLHDAFRKTAGDTGASKSVVVAHSAMQNRMSVLLATARIRVADRYGKLLCARALIDQGSEVTIITERLAQKLHLTRQQTSIAVFGVGGHQTAVAKGRVSLQLMPRWDETAVSVSAIVLPRLTAYANGTDVVTCDWPHLNGIELADPNFTSADPIDVLLGADVLSRILCEGLRKGNQDEPVAQKTIFGWVLSGNINSAACENAVVTHQCSIGEPLSALVRRFWDQEELPTIPPPLTREEQECEDSFVRTHNRTAEGRYVVRLPVASSLPDLTDTRSASVRSLLQTERRFQKSNDFCQLYKEFMTQYERLGHMSKVTNGIPKQPRMCYLPHHGVLRDSSTSTKLRVVFNGSWTTPTGSSLNQHLLTGKNLLPPLTDVLLRWRWHQYVIATDVEKMYRQILVHPDDRDLQRILWRENKEQPIQDFTLNTVTYGLACAPFLAIRTLKQLAADEGDKYPRGAAVLLQDVYVDDILTGADSVEEALAIQTELSLLCKAGGFPLKKWTANHPQLLDNIPDEDRAQPDARKWTSKEVSHSMLGLHWNPTTDFFFFTAKFPAEGPITKRSILSQTAQLFDPLGWLTPVTIRAKITIQTTWQMGMEWDEQLPTNHAQLWQTFTAELPQLAQIRIPRILKGGSEVSERQLHGFADASERAYAAVIYLKQKNADQTQTVSLVTAKSKVAPLKTTSIPRLELCAALLLARLVDHVCSVIPLNKTPMYMWTDSTVVLSWIKGHPSRWKTYVANRVAEIQHLVPDAIWNHLPGTNNPADCASRGLSPVELVRHDLWWKGPSFLHEQQTSLPERSNQPLDETLLEARAQVLLGASQKLADEHDLLKTHSDLRKLLRITAWCRRWLPGGRTEGQCQGKMEKGVIPPLLAKEVEDAERLWCRWVQAAAFKTEVQALKSGIPLPKRGFILKLNPFLDPDGILRVGGRIKHSILSFDERHPIILPPHSKLTELIIESSHRKSLHGGVQLTLSLVRRTYWIPRGRSLVKNCIHRCVTCARWRAASSQQLMADLPRARVTPARPFQHTGVDYAGPILLRTTPGRGHKTTKAFLVIFVCLSTKAVHLDVASDYTAEAFLAAFRRFVSRRGLCQQLFSDCGTNFVGADKELRKLFDAHSVAHQSISRELADSRVQWRFNPPSAPHFGGLWEAAVKSTKHHLRRVLGTATLTFEEMSTLLAQVEGCLNSRPLSALSDDPEDLAALTPGHFLIGTALTALPEPSLQDTATSRLSRWQHLQQMRDHFWARWSQEYLQGLLPRPKWQQSVDAYQPGRLCLIRNEHTSPSRWPLARILTVHPGADGHVRVVSVKTASTELVRPITKLILLPVASPIINK